MNFQSLLNDVMKIVFLGMAGAVIALERTGKGPETRDVPTNEKRNRYVLCGILLIALFLRVWQFGGVPLGMNQDGAMAAVDAKALTEYGTDRFGTFLPTHFTAWGFAQMNVFMSYCMVPFFKLFGMNVITARLPVLLFSMMGLLALYFTVKRLAGVQVAQVSLAFAAVNPWHFMQSRWALESNMFPHVLMIAFLFLLKALEGKRRWLVLSMTFFAASMYCYGIAFYTVPVFLAFMAGYFIKNKLMKWKDVLLGVFVYALFSWPIWMTMMINAFHWKTMETFFCTMPYFPESVRSKDILFFSDNKGEQLLKNLEAMTGVILQGDGLPWNTIPGYGVITACFLPFTLLGGYACVRWLTREEDPKRKAGFVALLAAVTVGLLSGLITAEVNVNRINLLHYGLLILTGFGICFMMRYLQKSAYVILITCSLMSIMFVGTYFSSHAETMQKYYYHDFLEAVTYAGGEGNHCTSLVITPDTQYVGAIKVSEILTMFALDVDAEFYQGKKTDQNGLTYGEKYRYENPRITAMDPGKPVAYVIRRQSLRADEVAYLEGMSGYLITTFGDYVVAVPDQTVK